MRSMIVLSIIIALTLSVIPLAFEWRWWRPEFIALLVIYWTMYSPQHFGIVSVGLCGFLLDIVQLSPLGYHVIGLLVIAYICHLAYQRIRSYALWQQAFWVFVLIGIYQLFCNWVSGFLGKTVDAPVFLAAALTSALFWPLLVILMAKLRVRFRLT